LDDRREPPGRRPFAQFRLEAIHPVHLLINGADRFLKHDLLRRRGTDDLGEVPPMRIGPIGPADVVQAEAEQERFQPQLRVLERQSRGVAGATAIADGFIIDRRDVDAGQIARPE
jgi:hypothetical protein